MNKVLLRSVCAAVATASLFWLAEFPANAMKPFRDEFLAKYVKPDSADAKEKAFAEAVATAKCNVCHQGKTKRERNLYGRAVNKFLSKEDKEDKEKIRAALDKTAEMRSDPDNPNSPTFGDLIKAGKLPGGEPKTGTRGSSN